MPTRQWKADAFFIHHCLLFAEDDEYKLFYLIFLGEVNPQVTPAFGFVTELFFLTHRCLQLGKWSTFQSADLDHVSSLYHHPIFIQISLQLK